VRVISLGAGVQSTTVLLLAHRGELPGGPVDYAIFADTGWEPPVCTATSPGSRR
jgi:3'-phosphoadenosine 5'-phosphosulfate sulfotransferase (PAPS reductase)/FAD synthetase